MAVSPGFRDVIEDLFSPLGQVRVRAMFGGGGIYCQGVMFGLIADDVLFLKVDDTTVQDYQAEGLPAFGYEGKGRRIEMSYRRAPERLFDDPDEAVAWGGAALRIALRAAAAKSARKSRAQGRAIRPDVQPKRAAPARGSKRKRST